MRECCPTPGFPQVSVFWVSFTSGQAGARIKLSSEIALRSFCWLKKNKKPLDSFRVCLGFHELFLWGLGEKWFLACHSVAGGGGEGANHKAHLTRGELSRED